MTKFAMSAFLMAVGLSGSLHAATARSNGAVEEVIRQAVSALAANDQPALDKLTIDQSEFKKYVWPGLATNMTGGSADKYYPTFQKVSQVGISEASAMLAGKKWEVVKVSLERAQRQGKGFQILGPPLVTVRDEGGQEKTVRLVGGLLERDGAYKVTSYYVSPSLRANK